jgi:hypothetical protein
MNAAEDQSHQEQSETDTMAEPGTFIFQRTTQIAVQADLKLILSIATNLRLLKGRH